MSDYDIAVLGAGPGGYVAAIRAAQLGARVVVIEKNELGGTCLNRGCIPTKAILESAKTASRMRDAESFGLEPPGEVRFSYENIIERKDRIVKKLTGGIGGLFKRRKIELIQGEGKLKSKNEIEVKSAQGVNQTVSADKLILATGSSPLHLSAFPVDGKKVFSSDEILNLKRMPASILIIGGGYIGCEFASIYAELGCQVTIIEMLERILPNMDEDLSKELTKAFRKKKMKIMTKNKIEKLDTSGDGVVAHLEGASMVEAEIALVSVGRKLETRGFGFEEAGIKLDRAAVPVDEKCRTNIENIYAIGDITAQMQLAHYASRQGIIAAENACGHEAKMNARCCPSAVFTHPEIGTVGLSEAQAKEKGYEVKVGRFPFQALGKALAMNETAGFVKVVGDAKTGEILGVHIIGPEAPTIIAEAALAIQLEATVEDLAAAIHTHPTTPEALMEASENWLGRAIHIP